VKTYKEYRGKIINISEAITSLYNVVYSPEKNILESDWLYCNRELKIGEEVRVHDGEEKFIM
jgi:hypothetical protein